MLSETHGENATEQCLEHLREFDELWGLLFHYRGRRRECVKREFASLFARKFQRMLTVYNNYDTAIHNAEMNHQRALGKNRQLQTEVAKLTQDNAHLKEQIMKISQNGRSEASLRAAGRGVRAIEAENDSIVGSGAGI